MALIAGSCSTGHVILCKQSYCLACYATLLGRSQCLLGVYLCICLLGLPQCCSQLLIEAVAVPVALLTLLRKHRQLSTALRSLLSLKSATNEKQAAKHICC
jgi:hypothetical protein